MSQATDTFSMQEIQALVLELERRPYRCEFCLSTHAVVQGMAQDIRLHVVDRLIEPYFRYGATWSCPSLLQQTIETPANWWEHLKERWAPAWVLKRWPVRRDVYEVRRMFPDFAIPAGKKKYQIVVYNGGMGPGPAQRIEKLSEPRHYAAFRFLCDWWSRGAADLQAPPSWLPEALQDYFDQEEP